MTGVDRRSFLRSSGVAALGVALAGCAGAGDTGPDDLPDFVDSEPDYGGWFDDVDNYEGTRDYTDHEEVTVVVGPGGRLAFAPPAILVSTDTAVVWEWTGRGGTHDVVDEGGAFESEQAIQEGHTFRHAFENQGTYRYVCTPHRQSGMKGAVVVE